jgi:putative holliday junction resolvase
MRFLGIDYGRRRIGLALSDATGLLARPWKTVARDGNPSQVGAMLASEIAVLHSETDGLEAVVLGFPRHLSGEEHDQSRAVRTLADHLGRAIAIPVHLQDERLSSREAESLLARTEKDWRRRKALLDAAAAAVILQDFLDTRASARDTRPSPRTTAAAEHDTDSGERV